MPASSMVVRPLAIRALRALALGLGAAALWAPTAARAIETIKLRLPLLDTDFIVRVSELRSPQALMAGDSDLAELDRATDGAIGRKLKAVMRSNLPLELRAVVRNAQGSPLLEQVLLVGGALGDIDGLPDPLEPAQFQQAMERAAAKGGISLLDVLEQLPGKSVTVQLGRLGSAVQRFRRQRLSADQLIATVPPVSSKGPWLEAGRFSRARRELTIAVAHRPEPLAVVVLESSASAAATNRLVVISHGLWLHGGAAAPSRQRPEPAAGDAFGQAAATQTGGASPAAQGCVRGDRCRGPGPVGSEPAGEHAGRIGGRPFLGGHDGPAIGRG